MEQKCFIKTDAEGRIVGRIDCFDPPANAYPEHVEIDCIPAEATHYIEGVFKTQPPQPSSAHAWDAKRFEWVLQLDLAKMMAVRRITLKRNESELSGFCAFGKIFDSDAAAVQRISLAAQSAAAIGSTFSIEWTCMDNSTIVLDSAQMQALPVWLAQAGDALHQKARMLKAQIEAATTLEEIDAVRW